MIIQETITINDKQFTRTYSDENRYVVRDEISYTEAVDPLNSGRVYTEGDIIPTPDNPIEPTTEIEEKAKAYDILMGVSE